MAETQEHSIQHNAVSAMCIKTLYLNCIIVIAVKALTERLANLQ